MRNDIHHTNQKASIPINVSVKDNYGNVVASGNYTTAGTYNLSFTPASSSATYSLEFHMTKASAFCFFRVDDVLVSYDDTTSVTVCKEVEDGYRYGFNSMEKDDQVKGRGNSYDFGARMYDSRLGRWLTIDAKASKYPDLSPYNFVANSPLIYVDPDGKKIVAYDEYSQTKTLDYLADQFGDGIFSFNRKGVLKIKNRAYKAFLTSTTTTDIQKELIEAIKEVVVVKKEYQSYVFEEVSKVNIYRNPQQIIGREVVGVDINGKPMVRDKMGPIYNQKDGSPGITFKGNNMKGGGTAVFGLEGVDPFIVIADKEASMDRLNTSESDAGGGDETKADPCASCVFIHEFLDHIYSEDMKSADINRSKSEKVKYHSKALQNKGSKPRSGSDH